MFGIITLFLVFILFVFILRFFINKMIKYEEQDSINRYKKLLANIGTFVFGGFSVLSFMVFVIMWFHASNSYKETAKDKFMIEYNTAVILQKDCSTNIVYHSDTDSVVYRKHIALIIDKLNKEIINQNSYYNDMWWSALYNDGIAKYPKIKKK